MATLLARNYSSECALVLPLSFELSALGRDDVGARLRGRPLNHSSLGLELTFHGIFERKKSCVMSFANPYLQEDNVYKIVESSCVETVSTEIQT
jgi:hypothetical protein